MIMREGRLGLKPPPKAPIAHMRKIPAEDYEHNQVTFIQKNTSHITLSLYAVHLAGNQQLPTFEVFGMTQLK